MSTPSSPFLFYPLSLRPSPSLSRTSLPLLPTAIPCTNGTLRLSDGFNPSNGRLEICVNEVWATVCGTGFTDEMAAAACTGMGLPSDGEPWGQHNTMYVCIKATDRTINAVLLAV